MIAMTKVKTAELEGAQLDWAVAKADGKNPKMWPSGVFVYGGIFRPSTDWSQGGPIIERELIEIEVCQIDPVAWQSRWSNKPSDWPLVMEGPTPLIAAMRAFVASKLGEEVDVPV